jgi:nucleotide-binding universal stress UspA family protein
MFGTILLAVDGSPHAERAAELVRRLAGESGDAVVVLHVTEIMPIRGGIDVELDQDTRPSRPPIATVGSSSWRACPSRSSSCGAGRAGGPDHRRVGPST